MPILLANPPHTDTFGYSMPAPGLLRLGGWLRDRGIWVELEDLAFRLASGEVPDSDDLGLACAELLMERMDPARGPWILGLSTMGATLPMAIVIARFVRDACPEVPILIGGPGTTGCDETILNTFPSIDAIVRGEGEQTLTKLMQHWEADAQTGRGNGNQRLGDPASLGNIRGLTFRTESGQVARTENRPVLDDLTKLSEPAWDLMPSIASYKGITGAADGLVPIDSGRGCVFDCSFCTIGRFWNRKSRTLPASRLAREITDAMAMPGAKSAYLCHDIFGANRADALEFCDEMLKLGGETPWEVRARIDHLDDELIAAMAGAGCYRVLLGIESASESVRKEAQKPFSKSPSRAQLLATVQTLSNAGVTPILSLILGLPGESDLELRDTLDFAAEACLAGAAQVSMHLVNPQPGCGLGESHAETSRPVEGIAPDMALGAGLTKPERDLIDATPGLFSSWSLLTGLEGGEERLLFLHSLAKSLPPALMRYPRTIAAVKRHWNLDTHDLAHGIIDSSCSFEGMVRRWNQPLLDDLLLWEMTRLRVGARGLASSPWNLASGAPVRVLVDTIAVRHDLGAIDEILTQGAPLPPPSKEPLYFAVGARQSEGDGGSSLFTHGISADLAQLLDAIRHGDIEPGGALGQHPEATIEHLETLAGGDLVSTYPAPAKPLH